MGQPLKVRTAILCVQFYLPAIEIMRLLLEELVGKDTPAAKIADKRGAAPKIWQQLEQIEALPKAKQLAIGQVLDSMPAAQR